jgi:hypothetical protein
MKRVYFALSVLLLAALACNFGAVPRTPTAPAADAAVTPAALPATETLPAPAPATETPAAPAAPAGTPYACDRVRLVIPNGLAAGIECVVVPPQLGEDLPPWEKTPGHIEIGLQGYALGQKFHRPRLYVYPTLDLVALQPYVIENINQVKAMLARPGGPFSQADLPGIHFFNAGTVFASNIALTNFVNGSGMRTLTVFGQYYAPVNNDDLFYHFQGLTSDDRYYIIAILPVTHPGLQPDPQESSLPASSEFPVYPGFEGDVVANMNAYYDAVRIRLDAASPDAFSPGLATLDGLIASLEVVP